MAISTPGDICRQALRMVGVIAESESPSSETLSVCFDALNLFVDELKINRLALNYIKRETFPITSGTGTYTVGPSGTATGISIRPTYVQNVNFVDSALSPSQEFPLGMLMTDSEWAGVPLKDLTSPYPLRAYWNPTFTSGLATVTFWPVPTKTTLYGVIYSGAAVAEFTTDTQSITLVLPPGWRQMLVTNLALRIAPMFGADATDDLRTQARNSLGSVKRVNVRTNEMPVQSGWLVGNPPAMSWEDFVSGNF